MTRSEELVEHRASRLGAALGYTIRDLIQKPDVEDIFANPDGRYWVRRNGKEEEFSATVYVHAVLNIVAHMSETVINREHPILETGLRIDGVKCRFEGIIPPVVEPYPSFSIRIQPRVVYSFHDYIENGQLSGRHAQFLKEAIRRRENILVVGGTGAGKTTFMNALIALIPEDERIVSIEDTPELRCSLPNYAALSVPIEQGEAAITMVTLLRCALRSRPRRILVGEVRGKEASALLEAWNTGHPGGIATVHADSAEKGIWRIQELSERLPVVVAETINVVVFIAEDAEVGRKVREVVRVNGYENGRYITEAV